MSNISQSNLTPKSNNLGKIASSQVQPTDLRNIPAPSSYMQDGLLRFVRSLATSTKRNEEIIPWLRDLTASEKDDLTMKDVLSRMVARLEKGCSLHEAMSEFPAVFDGFCCALVRAGEKNGELMSVARSLEEYLKRQQEGAVPNYCFMTQENSVWCDKFGTMLNCQVSFLMILEVLKDTSQGELAKATGDILEDIYEGGSVYSSMSRHPNLFSPILLEMVRCGEHLGRLAEIFCSVAERSQHANRTDSENSLYKFTKHLAVMSLAGVPLLRSLRHLAQTEEEQSPMRAVYGSLLNNLNNGSTFTEALAQHPTVFNKRYVSTIFYGETCGLLDAVLNELADYLENPNNIPEPKHPYVTDKLATWSEKFGMALVSGVPVPQTLNLLARLSEDKLKAATLYIQEACKNNESIACGMRRSPEVFPPEFISKIEEAEKKGDLPETLLQLGARKGRTQWYG